MLWRGQGCGRRRRCRDRLRPHHESRARPVVHDHRLAKRLLQLVGIKTCDRVHAGSGGQRNYDRDRSGGKLLRVGRSRLQQRHGQCASDCKPARDARGCADNRSHGPLPSLAGVYPRIVSINACAPPRQRRPSPKKRRVRGCPSEDAARGASRKRQVSRQLGSGTPA